MRAGRLWRRVAVGVTATLLGCAAAVAGGRVAAGAAAGVPRAVGAVHAAVQSDRPVDVQVARPAWARRAGADTGLGLPATAAALTVLTGALLARRRGRCRPAAAPVAPTRGRGPPRSVPSR